MTENELYTALAADGIAIEKLEHEAVFTVEESAGIHAALPASHTKNLFLRDKRGAFWLIVLSSERRADLKSIAETLGAGKFSFAKPADVERLLGVTPGAVTPLAAVNAPAGEVRVVFDAVFQTSDRIAVHPMRNTATIALAFGELRQWLSARNVPVAATLLG